MRRNTVLQEEPPTILDHMVTGSNLCASSVTKWSTFAWQQGSQGRISLFSKNVYPILFSKRKKNLLLLPTRFDRDGLNQFENMEYNAFKNKNNVLIAHS